MAQRCGNCAWAYFPTETIAGQCKWPIPKLPPMAIAVIVQRDKFGISPGHGASCPVWSGKSNIAERSKLKAPKREGTQKRPARRQDVTV
jgi:hypothetical protein